MAQQQELSITMTIPQAARRLGIGLTLARQLAREGRFPGAFLIGNTWRVHRAKFDEDVLRLASGEEFTAEPDQILNRALDDARLRTIRRKA